MQWERCSHLSTRECIGDQREIPSYLWQLGNSIEPKVKGLVENIHDTPHSRPPPLAHIARWLYLFNVSFNKTEACVSFHINRFKELLFEATSQLTEIDLLASGGPSIKQPVPPINTFLVSYIIQQLPPLLQTFQTAFGMILTYTFQVASKMSQKSK